MTSLLFVRNYDDIPRKKHRTAPLVCIEGRPDVVSADQLRELERFARVYTHAPMPQHQNDNGMGCVVFRKEEDGSWYRRSERDTLKSLTAKTFERALRDMYKEPGLPVPPEFDNRVAYFTLSLKPDAYDKKMLSYSPSRQYADGRVLVVPVPKMPVIRGKTSGAFDFHASVAALAAQIPTREEYRQLHKFGLALTSHAMAGEPWTVAGYNVESHASELKKRWIMVPHIFAVRKLAPNAWTAGIFDIPQLGKYNPGGLLFSKVVFPSVQELADNFIYGLNIFNNRALPVIDLTVRETDVLEPFPSTPARNAAYRKIAALGKQRPEVINMPSHVRIMSHHA